MPDWSQVLSHGDTHISLHTVRAVLRKAMLQAYIGGLAQLPAPDDQPLFRPPQSKKAKRKGLLNLAKGGKQVVQNVMKGVGLTPGTHRDETKPLVSCVSTST